MQIYSIYKVKNWNNNSAGKMPSVPNTGYVYPTMYRDNMYRQGGTSK